jgi:putative endonuclease
LATGLSDAGSTPAASIRLTWRSAARTARFAHGRPARENALSEAEGRVEGQDRASRAGCENRDGVFIVVVSMPFVYILRCRDRSLYIGHTNDLDARLVAHNDGIAALYTRQRRPVSIAYFESHLTTLSAIRRERQIKRWTRVKKEALVAGDRLLLKRL